MLEKRQKSYSPTRGGKIDQIIRANLRKAVREQAEVRQQQRQQEESSVRRKQLLEQKNNYIRLENRQKV